MKLFKKKPPWQDNDPALRRRALQRPDDIPRADLVHMALHDQQTDIRLTAVKRLNNITDLQQIKSQAHDQEVAGLATDRLEQLLVVALTGEETMAAAGDLLEHITDPENLLAVVAGAPDVTLRLLALQRLATEEDLVKAGRLQCGRQVGQEIIDRLNQRQLLEDLAATGGSKTIRRLAREKVQRLYGNEQIDSLDVTPFLQELVTNARRLMDSPNWELARRRFSELAQQWRRLDAETGHALYADFCAAREIFEQRYASHRQQMAVAAAEQQRCAKLVGQCRQLCTAMVDLSHALDDNAVNQLQHLRHRLQQTVQQLPAAQQSELANQCDQAVTIMEQALKAYPKEQQIVADCTAAAERLSDGWQEDPPRSLKTGRKLLQQIGPDRIRHLDTAPLRRRLEELVATIRQQQQQLRQELQQRVEQDLRTKAELVQGMEHILTESDHGTVQKTFQRLEDRFQALALDKTRDQELDKRYRRARAKFLVRQREFFSLEEWRLWANRNVKENLIAQVAALDGIDNLEQVVATVKQAQSRWQEIGPVPQKYSQRLWQQFHSLCEQQFRRAQPYLAEQKRLYQEKLAAKEELIRQAEELKDSEDWRQTTARYRELQKQWKEIGVLPSYKEGKLWKKFRRCCDIFFNRRAEYLARQDRDRAANLTALEQLCEQVERLVATPDAAHTREILRLQQQWKKTGPAPRRHQDRLWRRFRAGCDKHFHWLDQQRQHNLQQKQTLCQQVEEIVGALADKADLAATEKEIKALQEQWQAIGPVPRQQNESIRQRFRAAVDQFYAEKQQRFAEKKATWATNQRRKEQLIEQAEKLLTASDRESAAESLKELQRQWKTIGPAQRAVDRRLRDRFQRIGNDFFTGHQEQPAALKESQHARLREKERLCFQLEKLLELNGGSSAKKETLSLAEQLKLAMETNFTMANRDRSQAIREESQRIIKAWKALAPLPYGLEKDVVRRFQRALDYLEEQQREKKEGTTNRRRPPRGRNQRPGKAGP